MGELVRHEFLGGARVGDAEQRLRQAHEGDALLVGEPELLQERVEQGALVAARAAGLDQVASLRHGALSLSH